MTPPQLEISGKNSQTNNIAGKLSPTSSQSETAAVDFWQSIRTIIGLQNQAPPLQPVSRNQNLPLSFPQERLWFLDQFNPGSASYNLPLALRVRGALNVPALKESLQEIQRRHEALRTTFTIVDGQSVQAIAPNPTTTLLIIDLRELSPDRQEAETLALTTEEASRPFNLNQGPLFRATLIQLCDDEHVLLLNVHHIVFDGWSEGVLLRELAALYEAFRDGKPSPLPELPIQYPDFSVWQRQWLQGEIQSVLLSYWQQQLKNLPPQQLPADRVRPTIQTRRSASQTLALSYSLTDALKQLTRQTGGTLFGTLLTAFKLLLHAYTGQEDLFVCTTTANRNRNEIKGLIGYFTNLLVLRTDLSGSPSVRELLGRVRQVVSAANAHQDLPIQHLVNGLNLSQTPLSQVLFLLQNFPRQVPKLADLEVSILPVDSGTADFDLFLSLVEEGGELSGVLKYNTDIFDAATITRMLKDYQTLLEGIISNPDGDLSSLLLLIDKVDRQTLPAPEQELPTAFVAPRNETEEAIANLWAKVLGVEKVGIHDNFFSLGGHSLVAIELLSQMRATFNLDLPPSCLFQSPTVEKLAEQINAERQAKMPGKQTEQKSNSSIVAVKSSGSKKPFFFVAGGGGDENEFLVYANLARYLDPEQPVYGLKRRRFDEENKPYTEVEAMAAGYLKEIQAIQPEGPYLIGGECIGGLLAFAIAQQLQAVGQKVDLLLLMDAARPNNATYRRYLVRTFFKDNIEPKIKAFTHLRSRVSYHLSKLLQIKSGNKLTYIFNKGRRGIDTFASMFRSKAKRSVQVKRQVIPVESKQQVAHPKQSVQKKPSKSQSINRPQISPGRIGLLLRYRPQTYQGRITLLINEDLYQKRYHLNPGPDLIHDVYRHDPTFGWGHIATEGVDVHVTPGNHISYIRENVQSAAAKLNACLDKVSS